MPDRETSAAVRRTQELISRIRGSFNRLKSLGDQLHSDVDVTASMRAVAEALYEGGEQTVPQIARAKRVSRQHIQVLVNDLVAAGIAATRANPRDKRSPLVTLTKKGRTTFEGIRGREADVLRELARVLKKHDLEAALATLAKLNDFIDDKLNGGKDDD